MLRLNGCSVHAASGSSNNYRMKSLQSRSTVQMQSRVPTRPLWYAVLALVLVVGASAQNRTGAKSTFKGLEQRSRDQIGLLQDEKRSRSWFQKKLDSQIVYALRQKRLGAVLPGVSMLRARVSIEPSGSWLVDVRAQVSSELLDFIRSNGGTVVNSFPRYNAVRAMLPLDATEALAKRADVRWIRPAEEAITSTTAVEGNIAHRATEARQAFAIDGTGVRQHRPSGSRASRWRFASRHCAPRSERHGRRRRNGHAGNRSRPRPGCQPLLCNCGRRHCDLCPEHTEPASGRVPYHRR